MLGELGPKKRALRPARDWAAQSGPQEILEAGPGLPF